MEYESRHWLLGVCPSLSLVYIGPMRGSLGFIALLLATVACSSSKREYLGETGGGGANGTAGDGGGAGRSELSGGSGNSVGGGTQTPTGGAGSSSGTTATGTACVANTVKCGGAEVETTVLRCGAAQTEYTAISYCSDSGAQCNPTTGTCFKLGVDATEVTRAQYTAFLQGNKPTQGGICASINSSFVPDAACMAQATVCSGVPCTTHPQVCVDWCDAYAYCDSQGKRLCGRIGGGMNPFDRFDDPGSSEWMNACSAGGQYPYGSGSQVESGPLFCNYAGSQLGTTHVVGARARCVSPSPTYNQFFDLSGNVAEWENSCEHELDDLAASASDACRTRGGSFSTSLSALACKSVPASALRRDSVSPDTGFRCCAK